MLIGYARISTEDQKMDLQRDALKEAGVDDNNVYQEQMSAEQRGEIVTDADGKITDWTGEQKPKSDTVDGFDSEKETEIANKAVAQFIRDLDGSIRKITKNDLKPENFDH